MDNSALTARTKTITTTSSPQATCSQGNWSLLPSVVHRRGLSLSGNFPNTRLHNYPEKHRQRSRTVRHNRAAQAEVTTPYPGPRFPCLAATVAHCRINSEHRGKDREGEGDVCKRGKLTKIRPEEKEFNLNPDAVG